MSLTDVTTAAAAYGAEQYTQGKADQALTDAAALAAANDKADAAVLETQAISIEYAEYRRTHTVADPPPPPPPPPPSMLIGMNYSSTADIATYNKPYEPKAKVARVFVDPGRSSISQEGEYVRARDNGITTIIFSWKDTTVPAWLGTVPKEVKWYGVAHHEPEDLAAVTWKTLQIKHMPAVRAAGGLPTFIFTNFGLNPKNATMKLADWVPPAGTFEVGGVDIYPDKASNLTQAQCVANWKAAMKLFGVNRFIIGEYGVISTAADAVADIKEIKPLIKDWVEAACYWSSQKTGFPNYRFSTATSTAWFGA